MLKDMINETLLQYGGFLEFDLRIQQYVHGWGGKDARQRWQHVWLVEILVQSMR